MAFPSIPPPSMEPHELRPVYDFRQFPVGHAFELQWYQTSDTKRGVFLGYNCKFCDAKTIHGRTLEEGCPAFYCTRCFKWYEAPLPVAYLPGADRGCRLCLGCLKKTAVETADRMQELIAQAEGDGK